MMKAIVVVDEGATLVWTDVPRPEPRDDEVLVRVHATALNRADLLQRAGKYPVPKGASPILGLEMAGEVVELGHEVDGVYVGDRVCALLDGGGYAEYVCVHAGMLLHLPEHIGMSEAAAIPEVFYTAYLNLYLEGELVDGERALVHAGSSGVGTAALQLCRLFGNPVYTTTSAAKVAELQRFGATRVIDRENESFVSVIKELGGVDVILDPVGGRYLADNLAALARRGRLVIIGLLGGASAELQLARLLMNRQRVIGSVLRSRSRDEKLEITRRFVERVWPAICDGRLHAVIDSEYDIVNADAAHARMRSNAAIGKVVLNVPRD